MGAYELDMNLGSLNIAAGQTVTLPSGGYSFIAQQLSVAPTGTLDIANNALLIDYTGSSPIGGIRTALQSGRAGGSWTGAGIISSAARGDSHHTIGYGEATDLGLTNFAGQSVDSTAVLIKYALTGDANLDGKRNGDDYFQLDSHVGAFNDVVYVHGDLDYNALVNGDDYFLLDSNFV